MMDRALLWLHEQEVIRLNKGLTVLRPAMTMRLRRERRGFARADFTPLDIHYKEQVLQIHVMMEYVQRALGAMADALRLAMDYFSLRRDEFLNRWLPDRVRETERQTTPESWRAIVESLNNPIQRRIVADDRERANVLVLAGPGSGKTKALVHRIAYLIRAPPGESARHTGSGVQQTRRRRITPASGRPSRRRRARRNRYDMPRARHAAGGRQLFRPRQPPGRRRLPGKSSDRRRRCCADKDCRRTKPTNTARGS